MERTRVAALGVYANASQAEEAVDHLIAEQFASDHISVLLGDVLPQQSNSRPRAALGGTLGLLAGLATLVVPGSGSMTGAGPIMSVLADHAREGLVGALMEMGVPQPEATRFDRKIGEGSVLISVHCPVEQAAQAGELLKSIGAQEIFSGGARRDHDVAATPSSRT